MLGLRHRRPLLPALQLDPAAQLVTAATLELQAVRTANPTVDMSPPFSRDAVTTAGPGA